MRNKIRFVAIALTAAVLSVFVAFIPPPHTDVDVVVPVDLHATNDTDQSSIFKKAVAVVFDHEGYFSDDKADRGGATKFGVSLRFLVAEKIDIDGDGDSDLDDILALTKTDADRIYFEKFWQKYRFDRIIDEQVAIKLFDTSINTGNSRAARIAKKAINKVVVGHIDVDGNFDDETIALINNLSPDLFLKAYRAEQAAFYEALIKQTPEYEVFRNGWKKRAYS